MCPTPTPGTHTIPFPKPPSNSDDNTLCSDFGVLDADGDGRISYEDLWAFYAEDEDAILLSMMSVADSNQDGFVDYDEFQKQLLIPIPNPNHGIVMEDAFRVMDRDGDGKVGQQVLRAYLPLAGVDAYDDDISAMIKLAAAGDPDGAVILHALLNILPV